MNKRVNVQGVAVALEWHNNPDSKLVEIDRFKNQAVSNAFTMSPAKWIENTNAIGIISNSGKYGGIFAHKDIAFEESLNAEYIKAGLSQQDRLVKLNRMAIEQMEALTGNYSLTELKRLGDGTDE